MFKKLFISLIILSALTTEGVVVYQRDYNDLFLCLQNGADACNSLCIPIELNTIADDKESSFLYNEICSFNSMQLAGDKGRLKYNNSFGAIEKYTNNCCLTADSNAFGGGFAYLLSREPSIVGTDSSPPSCNI